MPIHYTYLDSPTGSLLAIEEDGFLVGLHFEVIAPAVESDWIEDSTKFDEIRSQLNEYFDGDRVEFDIPLAPTGTEFQKEVWGALQRIPYGETVSYSDIAIDIGRPKATRAVGTANGSNRIPIVIPCHRVVTADGGIGGFAPGTDLKFQLLALEGAPTPTPS